jgi:hypothetical protein
MSRLLRCKMICHQLSTHIKEHNVPIGISITAVNAVEPLWELHVADISANSRVHHEAHCFTNSFAVVNIVITVKIKNVRSICQNSRHSDLPN